MNKILVVVVTYNAMKWADHCFNSLRNSTIESDVFVVDNGSKDGTQAYIQANYPEVIFYQSNGNLGFGKANNKGLQYAIDHDYDYVYLLNQDAWVMPDTFERLIFINKKYPEYGILSPFQMNSDLQTIDRNFASNVCNWKSNHELLSDLYNQTISDIYSVKSVMAAHWFLPIATVREVGGFSPSFPHYGEDDNFIIRALRRNYKIGIVPSLRVVHDRADRIETPKLKMYKGYIESILCMSDPSYSFFEVIGMSFYTMISNIVKYKSIKPLSYFVKLLWNTKSILKNKRISLTKECAFLES